LSKPRAISLVLDATFLGKREDKFGLLVAKDVDTKEIISYHFIESETLLEYQVLKSSIESKGFTIKAITIDGRRGLLS